MTQYDDETQLVELSGHQWEGTVNGNWNIGDNPNGGYLVSLALRALTSELSHPSPITVTTHFLRPGIANRQCIVKTKVLKTGRMLSFARATLYQDDKARIEVIATFGDLGANVGVSEQFSVPVVAVPALGTCVRRSGDLQGIELPILQRLDVFLDPACLASGSSTRAEIAGWIRFSDERPPDAAALVLFADAFPPSVFSRLGIVGWVPTVELTVQIRRQPAVGWVRAKFDCVDLQGGRMIESGMLWDSSGQLVAQSRQLGLVLEQDN